MCVYLHILISSVYNLDKYKNHNSLIPWGFITQPWCSLDLLPPSLLSPITPPKLEPTSTLFI